MQVSLGEFSIPAILAVVMMLIYKSIPMFPDRWKPLLTILIGIAVGIVAMFYTETVYTFQIIVNYVLLGLMAGAAAVGLYEGQDKGREIVSILPRTKKTET